MCGWSRFKYTHSLRDCIFLVHEIHLCLWVENLKKLNVCVDDDNKFKYEFTLLRMLVLRSMLSLFSRRYSSTNFIKKVACYVYENDGECVNKTKKRESRKYEKKNNSGEERLQNEWMKNNTEEWRFRMSYAFIYSIHRYTVKLYHKDFLLCVHMRYMCVMISRI